MEKIGKLYPADAKLAVDEKLCNLAEDEGDPDYEIRIDIGSRAPILRSVQTGKWFMMTWWDIKKLAVQAGIDEP